MSPGSGERTEEGGPSCHLWFLWTTCAEDALEVTRSGWQDGALLAQCFSIVPGVIPPKILAGFGGAGVQASQNFNTTLVILVCIQDWECLS